MTKEYNSFLMQPLGRSKPSQMQRKKEGKKMKKEVKEKIEYLKGTNKPYLIVIRDHEIVNVDDYLPLIYGNLLNGLYNTNFNNGLSRMKEKCNYTERMEFEESFPNTPGLKYIYINIPCNMNQLNGYKIIDDVIQKGINGGF